MMPCSMRTSHGVRECITKFSDWYSMLENVALDRSATRCGGTRKMRQISVTENCFVSKNWLSSGGREIGL